MAEIDLYDYDHVYFKSPTPYLVSICTDSWYINSQFYVTLC